MSKLSTGFDDIPANVREQMRQEADARDLRCKDRKWDLYHALVDIAGQCGDSIPAKLRERAERALAFVDDREVDPEIVDAARAEFHRYLAEQDQLKLPGVAA